MIRGYLKFGYLPIVGICLLLAACGGQPSGTKSPAAVSEPLFQGGTTLSAPLGVREGFTLPDSSHIILNAASRLRYAGGFPDSNRLMAIDGDAFLMLKKSSLPVTLHTGMLLITGQQAAFRIYARSKSPGQSLEVLSGALQVAKAYPSDYPDTEQLRAGDMVMINRDIDLMEKETFDTLQLKEWIDGKLVFQHASLAEVIRKLEDWYAVDIEVSGNGPAETGATDDSLTATFDHASLPTVLDKLGKRYGFTSELDSSRVILKWE